MKKVYFILPFLLLLSGNVQCQDDEIPVLYRNELHLGFFHFVNGTFHLEYERFINDNNSIQATGEITLVKDENRETLGGLGEIQYRYYIMNNPFDGDIFHFTGIYVAPYAFYGYLDQTDFNTFSSVNGIEDEHGWYSRTGTGLLLGVKSAVTEQLLLDFSFGGGLKYLLNETNTDSSGEITIFDPSYSGIAPRVNFTIGIKF